MWLLYLFVAIAMDCKFRKEKCTSNTITDNKSLMLLHNIKHATSHWWYINHSTVKSASFSEETYFLKFLRFFTRLNVLILSIFIYQRTENYWRFTCHCSPSTKFTHTAKSEKPISLKYKWLKDQLKNWDFKWIFSRVKTLSWDWNMPRIFTDIFPSPLSL